MDKKFLFITLIMLFSGVFIINMLNPSESLPINFSRVNKIEIYDLREEEYKKLITIENKTDITSVNKIINKAEGSWYDKTSCPFSLSMCIYEGEKKITIILGTDDCGYVIYNNKCFKIPDEDIKQFQSLIENLTGINFDKLRL